MQAGKDRAEFSSLFGFHDKMSLVSYVPKRRRAVIILSTAHYTTDVSGTKNKPNAIHYYNNHKSGVDNMCKMLSEYTVKRATKRWPQAIFFNMVDVCALAAYIIYYTNNPVDQNRTCKRREFLTQLGKELAMPQIEIRAENLLISSKFGVRSGIECMLGKRVSCLGSPERSLEPTRDSTGRKKIVGRCFACYKGHTKRKRHTRKACSDCNRPICDEHSVTFQTCFECR